MKRWLVWPLGLLLALPAWADLPETRADTPEVESVCGKILPKGFQPRQVTVTIQPRKRKQIRRSYPWPSSEDASVPEERV